MPSTKFRSFLIAAAFSSASAFAPAFSAPFDKIQGDTEAALAGFEKVYIAPVKVELADKRVRRSIIDRNSPRPVSQSDKALKAQDAYEDIVRAFSKKFQIVEAPGSDVLTVEAVVTKLISSRPTLEDYNQQATLNFQSVYAGGADFDVRLLQGDAVLVEISDSNRTSFNDGRPRIGIWQDYDYVSNRFARKLARYVQQK